MTELSLLACLSSESLFYRLAYLYKPNYVLTIPIFLSSSLTHFHNCSITLPTNNQTPTNKQPQPITMDSIKQGANYVSETVQKAASGASKETNKEVAKDSNASIGTR